MSGAPYYVAHRAGNDPRTLLWASGIGADLIELDLRFRHGRFEVRHLKSMGPLPLLWDKWRLAPGWTERLLLDALLSAVPESCELMLDLKPGPVDSPKEIVQAMRRLLPGRDYTVCSQSWKLLEPFHDEPGVRIMHSVGSRRMLHNVVPHLKDHRSDAVAVHARLLDRESVARLRQCVPLIFSWPVNSLAELRRLEAFGVNGFIIDDPVLIETMIRDRYEAERQLEQAI